MGRDTVDDTVYRVKFEIGDERDRGWDMGASGDDLNIIVWCMEI